MKNGNGDTVARNIIAQGTTIQGDIISSGDLRIEGSLNGTIKVKGKVVIGETGNVEGQVHCQSADISGTAKVKLDASELTTLRATSKFSGDIITKKISIEPGALFSGTCQMGSPSQPPVPSHIKSDVKTKTVQ
ncbi:MAG: polymer-forming cytoskeletal protein [Chlorobi bacterium]|nr:polymer-forming cytoskeletal protein [Chlorobiota bacterium]